MLDTMTLTKIVGGFCGALLIFLLGKWAGELIYHSGSGHGEGHEQAYVIETPDEGESGGEEDSGPSFAELFVNADAGKGERVFNKCKACHSAEEGDNGTGPYLYGVVGRDVDTAEGYSYSGNLEAAADVWTPENLDAFLEKPSGFAPGTTMGFPGLRDAEDRANVIAYLDQTDGDTYEMELPEAGEGASDEGAEDAAEEPAAEDGAEEEASDEAASEAAAEETASDGTAEDGAADTAAAEGETGGAAAEEESGFAAMVAAADPADGEKVFRKCQACHVVDKEQNRVGPHMVGLIGREIGGVEGFNYSDALKEMGGEWTVDKLNAWLENPRGFASGNRMSFPGLRKEEDRASVIAYIESVSN